MTTFISVDQSQHFFSNSCKTEKKNPKQSSHKTTTIVLTVTLVSSEGSSAPEPNPLSGDFISHVERRKKIATFPLHPPLAYTFPPQGSRRRRYLLVYLPARPLCSPPRRSERKIKVQGASVAAAAALRVRERERETIPTSMKMELCPEVSETQTPCEWSLCTNCPETPLLHSHSFIQPLLHTQLSMLFCFSNGYICTLHHFNSSYPTANFCTV